MTMMKAAVYHGRKDVRIEEVPVPAPGLGELLLRVAAVGICGTDAAEFSAGPSLFPIHTRNPFSGHEGPLIPGHELSGTVVAAGEGADRFPLGSLVVSGAGVSCGSCHWCTRGQTNICASYSTIGLQRNGALAGYVTVPQSTCVDVGPYGLGADTAALAQPMSIAVHAMRRGRLESGDVAVIVGVGGIGAFLTFACADAGATVVVTDLDEGRLSIASACGADVTLQTGVDRPLGEVLETQHLVPSVVYEVSGSAAGIAEALAVAPPGCRVVLVGHQHESTELNLKDVSLRELELVGTQAHCAGSDLPEALRLLASRADGWTDIAPDVLALDELVDKGLAPLAERRSRRIKTLIDPWAPAGRPAQAGGSR
jgi:(R,R)-butanediol dehydrogenase/meso-butanediol dehydrogenase/diacetyl reductase